MSRQVILDPIAPLFNETLVVPKVDVLILSDTHCPYQNKELIIAAITEAKRRKIKNIIFAGDLIDGASYNSQARNEAVSSIETDIEHACSFLSFLAAKKFNIWLLPGNHDHFYLKKEKISFESFIKERVLKNKYKDLVYTTEYDYLYYDQFAIIGHPTGYESVPGKLAMELATKYNMHAFIGHDHLRGFMRAENGMYGVSIGGSFQMRSFWYKERAYNTFPHSMLGFLIIEHDHIWQYDEKLHEIQII